MIYSIYCLTEHDKLVFKYKLLLIIILFILINIILILYKYWLISVKEIIYFNDDFDKGIENWEALDASYYLGEGDGIAILSKNEYMTPYLMKKINIDSIDGNYVWSIKYRISKFTNNAYTVGTLVLPTKEITIVINKKENIGIGYSLFEKPVYSNKSILRKLNHNEWHTIYVYVNDLKDKIIIYNDKYKLLEEYYDGIVSPIQEIWLGTIWLYGEIGYGSPIDVRYDKVSVGNIGILPKKILLEYYDDFKSKFKKLE